MGYAFGSNLPYELPSFSAMDKTFLLFIRAVLSVAVLGATATYYYFVATKPDYFSPNSPSYQPHWDWKRCLFYGAAMIGTGICIFLGTRFLLGYCPPLEFETNFALAQNP
ncbi:MAG: hypothetical protein QOJ15_8663 [Bradyrhizobium sp.]|nr:hypothetical protein [Bradyrhizobium sp.]